MQAGFGEGLNARSLRPYRFLATLIRKNCANERQCQDRIVVAANEPLAVQALEKCPARMYSEEKRRNALSSIGMVRFCEENPHYSHVMM